MACLREACFKAKEAAQDARTRDNPSKLMEITTLATTITSTQQTRVECALIIESFEHTILDLNVVDRQKKNQLNSE